tara:strand:+ start:6035 stop:6841 length:807 start_codon:yes stop_codon:yes gene_type:complete
MIIIFLIFILYLNNIKETFSDKIHPINKYFTSVNVIAIPKRKEYMIDTMNYFEIKANIIDATLKKNIDYNELLNNNFITPKYYSEENKGRIACHLSQIKLIKEFYKSAKDDDTLFIFEDDIQQQKFKNYKNMIEDSMSKIPSDWDIVFFGRCFDDCNKMKKISKYLYKVNYPKCRHAYGLSKKGARKILQYTVPMIDNGDEMYAQNIKNGNIKAYAIHPSIFSQNRVKLGSNIGNDIKNVKKISQYFYKALGYLKKNKSYEGYPPTCK